MNKLNTNKSITSSSYRKKKIKKVMNIDTIIFDDECSFEYNYDYNNIKNIIFDCNKIEGPVYIPSRLKYVVENISFVNYPILDGITIPISLIKTLKEKRFNFESAISTSNIKKINILYDGYVEEILLDKKLCYFKVYTFTEDDNTKIKIELFEDYIDIANRNIRKIIFDSNGKQYDYYAKYFLNIKNNEDLDLRDYSNKRNIYLNDDITKLNKVTINISALKNITLHNFNKIEVGTLEIIDDNDMKLIPNNINISDVKIIIKNSNNSFAILAKNINTKEMKYIYLDNDNKLNIIDNTNLKDIIDYIKYDYINEYLGLLIQYKGNLKFDLIINNKIYKIDKIFINWIMGNYYAIKFKEKIINKENLDKKNIMELDKILLNDIKEEISDEIFGVIFYQMNLNEFVTLYELYEKYLKHLEYLKEKGFKNKTLYYLHKYNYDNITGVNERFDKEILENKLVIESFNNLGKTLTKKKD